MGFTTVGILLQQMRDEKKITRKQLADGICSKQVLAEVEANRYEADTLTLDIFMQRLGKSPDKFEMLLKVDTYNMVRLRDLIEETIYRGKRDLAEKLLHKYPSRTNVDKMYQYRMKASILYHIDKNCKDAAKSLQKAIFITLPDFSYDQIEEYMISTVEMENLLALERMYLEEKYQDTPMTDTDMTKEKQHLELCMNYMDQHFEDGEEHAKIFSKCAWLLSGIYYLEKNYIKATRLCEKGMEVLRRNTVLYFMLPLLELETKAQEALGMIPERSKWVQYYEILKWIWTNYAKEWYPTNSLFHNCCQREYHLDYEFIRAERKAQEMTQQKLAEGVYQNTECLSRVE
ncbi:MAG: helix-turn-helix transcriptional regulator, partial [Lachnospiraceae bacterium]|nr:helix-turn-helix transcriptional regulator [Lachnospiraceae bacterium]